MAAPAPYQPTGDETGLTRPGAASVLLHQLQSNAFLHREIVQKGRFEFLLHSVRSDVLGLRPSDYGWVFTQLLATKPPDLRDLPNGTVLDEHGFVVPPTRDDLKNAKAMADVIARGGRSRVFLS